MKQNHLQRICLLNKIGQLSFVSRFNNTFKNKNIYQNTIRLLLIYIKNIGIK